MVHIPINVVAILIALLFLSQILFKKGSVLHIVRGLTTLLLLIYLFYLCHTPTTKTVEKLPLLEALLRPEQIIIGFYILTAITCVLGIATLTLKKLPFVASQLAKFPLVQKQAEKLPYLHRIFSFATATYGIVSFLLLLTVIIFR